LISATLLFWFFTALGVSFVCSILEAILLATSRSHVELLRREGKRSGQILHELKRRIDHPLIGILTLNTLANMFGSAGVGAETARLAVRNNIDQAVPVAIAAGLLTLSILVLSEIVPKTLGATYCRRLAAPASYAIRAIVVLLWPVIRTLEIVPKLVARADRKASVSREEIAVLAQMGGEAGTLPARESDVIGNLLRLNLMRAKDVMTPRVELFTLPQSMTAGQAAREHTPIRFSRIPIYDDSVDRITGLVLRHQILEACVTGRGNTTLGELKHPLKIFPETKTIASLLDEFTRTDDHMFLIVDEYGGTEGVVTLEDVLETLLGVEITDEMDAIENLRRIAIARILSERSGRSGRSGARPSPAEAPEVRR